MQNEALYKSMFTFVNVNLYSASSWTHL